ncbi:MAG TPA: molybdate ABC transporter substrate-binding protein [Candidatus Acidoferrales bacterium]|nr:molybdate ABC transporter substrate-binding protein [Candidatus Acidoferrales bacterium]
MAPHRPPRNFSACFTAIAFCALLAGCGANAIHSPNQPVTLTVSAAISMKGPLDTAAQNYDQQHPGVRVICNYGASGTLQHQIEQGAPVDVFISAGEKQMNALQNENLLAPGTRRDLLANTLVLIAPANSTTPRNFNDLAESSIKSVALGEPRTVPAGMYAQQVLDHLHLFSALKSKIVYAQDVREVLAFVETGNASAGLAYATDARISNRVRVVATAPPDSHDAILYPVALLQASKSPEAARAFLDALESLPSLALFEKYGFTAPPAAAVH